MCLSSKRKMTVEHYHGRQTAMQDVCLHVLGWELKFLTVSFKANQIPHMLMTLSSRTPYEATNIYKPARSCMTASGKESGTRNMF